MSHIDGRSGSLVNGLLGTAIALLATIEASSQRLEGGATAALAAPTYHFWPSARSSQDISGPIGVKLANGTLVWHVFVDCVDTGWGGHNLDCALPAAHVALDPTP